ncbi:MAG: AAA family ATPase [Oligoflexia bacterium]
MSEENKTLSLRATKAPYGMARIVAALDDRELFVDTADLWSDTDRERVADAIHRACPGVAVEDVRRKLLFVDRENLPEIIPGDESGKREPLPISPGAKVIAGDRDNVGEVLRDDGGSCLVKFVSPSGTIAERSIDKTQLKTMSGEPLAGDAGANDLKPIPFDELNRNFPELRPEVIGGLLRRGETINLVAPPKAGKSFLLGNLAWSVATGADFLGFPCQKSRVLVLDNELHAESIAYRLRSIADAMGIGASYRSAVDVIPLRGRSLTIDLFGEVLGAVPAGEYGLICVDALYRALPEGTNENGNYEMMTVYNHLDSLAHRWQSSFVVIHHTSKGAQGEKGVTDYGAGAGSVARAADDHFAIREHEEEGHFVLEGVCRSFKSPEPVTIKFDFPLWSKVDLAPKVRRTKARDDEQKRLDAERCEQILSILEAKSERVMLKRIIED